MGFDRIYGEDNFRLVRKRMQKWQCEDLLIDLYRDYRGFELPSERAEFFRDRIDSWLSSPPATLDATPDVVAAMLKGICHGIYAEHYLGLPWSLQQYSMEQIDALFYPLHNPVPPGLKNETKADPGVFTEAIGFQHGVQNKEALYTSWYQAFPLAYFVTDGACKPIEAVEKCVAWVMSSFFHAAEDWGWKRYRDAPSESELPVIFAQRIIGCHLGAKILASLLKAINIPAYEFHYAGHGVCFIPTVNRYVHGDYLADFLLFENDRKIVHTKSALLKYLKTRRGYLHFHDTVKDKFANYDLWRRGDGLHIRGDGTRDPAEGMYIGRDTPPNRKIYSEIQRRLPHLDLHPANGKYYSKPRKIRGPDEIIECGLRVTPYKDEKGNVYLQLENRGHRYTVGAGEIAIDVDGKHQASRKIAGWLCDNFKRLDGGVIATWKTGIRIRHSDLGTVKIIVSGLTNPEHDFELGFRLNTIRPDGPLLDFVDLNRASLRDLLRIIHIGPERAWEIVLGRPWPSLKHLVHIKGIASQRMRDILDENLAVVLGDCE